MFDAAAVMELSIRSASRSHRITDVAHTLHQGGGIWREIDRAHGVVPYVGAAVGPSETTSFFSLVLARPVEQ